MAFDSQTRNRLAQFVAASRKLLCGDFNSPGGEIGRLLAHYGIQVTGECADLDVLTHLDEVGLETARTLRAILDHKRANAPKVKVWKKFDPAIYDLLQEQGFTVLNRLCALRMAEERRLVIACVSNGMKSDGFELYEYHSGKTGAANSADLRYRQFLFSLCDELALDLGTLFDRFIPQSILFPGSTALNSLLDELNHSDLASLWAQDETIGWIYQYWNSKEERTAMRDTKSGGSAAPRNSRELAVRNQFFTPRYVVEFLTDNTLGRIWYEMCGGETALRDKCRYLVRRADEVFLGHLTVSDSGTDRAVSDVATQLQTGSAESFVEFSAADPDRISHFCHTVTGYQRHPANQDLWEGWFPEMERCLQSRNFEDVSTQDILDFLFLTARNDRHGGDGSVYSKDWFVATCNEVRSRVLRSREDGWSQEEMLQQPMVVPFRSMKDPREIRLLDPACGSMHFGLYAFDLFITIYEEAWELASNDSVNGCDSSFHQFRKFVEENYSSKELYLQDVPRLIIEHNIHGVDIDPRAAQIAGLSLWLRAQREWGELAPEDRPCILRSNIVCAEPMPGKQSMLEDFVQTLDPPLLGQLVKTVFDKMQLAGEAGTLLKIEEEIRTAIDDAKEAWESAGGELPGLEADQRASDFRSLSSDFWNSAEERIDAALRDYAESAEAGDYERRLFAEDAARGFALIDLCRKHYDVVVMNPPFGDASLPSKQYIDETYGDTKGDVYKAFVECFQERLAPSGLLGIISSRSGFFLGQSEDWRTRVVLRSYRPIALADLGSGVLDATVEVAAYVLRSLSKAESYNFTLSLVPALEDVARDQQDRFSLPKWQSARGGLKRHQAIAELEHLEAHGFVERSPGNIVRYSPLWSAVKKISAPPDPSFPPFFCIRALDEEDKGKALLLALRDPANSQVFTVNPAQFTAIPCRTFAYWAGNRACGLFSRLQPLESSRRTARQGLSTADDVRFVRLSWEPGRRMESSWVPFAKGGSFSPIYSDLHLVVNWGENGEEIKAWAGTLYNGSHWSRIIKNVDFYRRPGLTWPRRSQRGFGIRVMPQGSIFADKGPAIFIEGDANSDLLATLAISNSAPFKGLIALQMAFGSYEVGVIQRTPLPIRDDLVDKTLADHAQRIWEKKREVDSHEPTSRSFCIPALIAGTKPLLEQCYDQWNAHIQDSAESCASISSKIDRLAADLYGLSETDCAALVATTNAEDDEAEVSNPDRPALVSQLLDYAVGTALGRWDIRFATGERQPPKLPAPFDPLPLCPPGMLQNAVGLPMDKDEGSKLEAEGDYPLRVSWSGILVDDDNHMGQDGNCEDIVERVGEALELIWPGKWEAIRDEACAALGVQTLRAYFYRFNKGKVKGRTVKGFFESHLDRYSKSKRKAPIYWPLSTESGSYTLWVYYPRLTKDTLYSAVTQFIEPKQEEVQKTFNRLNAQKTRSKREDKELETAQLLIAELAAFRESLLEIAKFWKPNLNDGVQITAAPLWKHFRFPDWQKKLKETWKKLEAGEYDWAHLAHSTWPQRVIPKCAEDRSLAIAHNHEELWEEVPDAKGKLKWQPKPDAEEIAASIVRELK